jgi:ketosteroid isomerase-like protein
MTRRSWLAHVGVAVSATAVALDAALSGQGAGESRSTRLAATERAFAKTMADRDHVLFASFIAEDGVFFGQSQVLRGRAEVAAGWKRYFEGPRAPFSWEPDRAEVLDSGTLGMTSGAVRDPDGTRIGTFTTTWRLEPDGRWRVVFDIGCPPCECK